MSIINCNQFVLLLIILLSINSITNNAVTVTADPLNVHIVCHTHDDVGWLKTVDQYFMGANNSIQHAGVQYILDSVIPALVANPARKFVYVEQAFFTMWLNQQSDSMKSIVAGLVKNGQLYFINGGYCMHDEATAYYADMIDNTALGHKYLLANYQFIPTIGWQIDPFGHSATQASLLSYEAGFDALYFGRIDYQDHDIRMANSNMEFIWSASKSAGSKNRIFTGAFQSGNYGPPDGFCWDIFCDDLPIQDDHTIEDYNVGVRLADFLARIQDQASHTLGNNIMITMGSDFQYEQANEWYKQLDKLIAHVQSNSNYSSKLNLFYSTPQQYTTAKLAEGLNFTVKTDDFFPYADNEHSYWTGYFTSRPALKHYIRTSSALLNTGRQLEVIVGGTGGTYTESLWQSLSIAQHHDAVSGTSKQHVAFDYAKKLSRSAAMVQSFLIDSLSTIITKSGAPASQLNLQFCNLMNISICTVSQQSQQSLVIILYNPLGHIHSETIRIPISNSNNLSIIDSNNNPVKFDLFPATVTNAFNTKSAPFAVYFQSTVPAMGYNTYFIIQSPATATIVTDKLDSIDNIELDQPTISIPLPLAQFLVPTSDTVITNQYWSLTFSANTGLLKSAVNQLTGKSYSLTQQFYFYHSFIGTTPEDQQNSGAYIFRPYHNSATPIDSITPNKLIVNRGTVINEVVQHINEYITQTIRLNSNSPIIEFEWTIGPIDISDNKGKEIISRYTVDNINSNSLFYTDSNGREIQQRQRNYRPTWNWTVTEPTAGNYYPATSAVYIEDAATQLSIALDRAQGVSSLIDGTLELMLHRRIIADDGRGVGEPLNETDSCTPYPDFKRVGKGLIITGKHYLSLLDKTSATNTSPYRSVQESIVRPITIAISPLLTPTIAEYQLNHILNNTFLNPNYPLPANIGLLTLQSIDNNNNNQNLIVIRLAHLYGINEDSILSQPAQIDFNQLFNYWNIESIKEYSLTNNQLKSELDDRRRNNSNLKLNERHCNDNDQSIRTESPIVDDISDTIVTFQSLQIRTFQILLGQK